MNRKADMTWLAANRAEMSRQYEGQWLVVHNGQLVNSFKAEEEALAFAVEKFGIDKASVFRAELKDPFVYVG